MARPGLPKVSATLWGSILIALSFIALFVLEPLFLNRSRKFISQSESSASTPKIPLDEKFSLIYPGKMAELAGKKQISLKELATRNLLINFWATWCDPCIEEIPSLNLLAKQLHLAQSKTTPLLVTISVDEMATAVKKLEKSLSGKYEFIVLHDPDGKWAKSLNITKFPETFLIAPDGNLLFKWIGPQDWLSLETLQILSRG